MRIKILTSVVVAVMMSATSLGAIAATTPDASNALLDVNTAKSYADTYSENQNSIEQLKQQLQKKQIEEQIRQINAKAEKESQDAKLKEEQEKWNAEKKALIEQYEAKLSLAKEKKSVSGSVTTLHSAQDDLDGFYVTRISAIGGQMQAKVYIDNSISTKGVGDYVAPGVKITKITKDGITVSSKEQKKFVPITTISRAQFKSFEKTSDQSLQGSGSEAERQLMGVSNGYQPTMPFQPELSPQ